MNFEICRDCTECEMKSKKAYCREKFDRPIDSFDDCPLDITLDEINEINETAEKNKVKIVNKSDKPRKKAVSTRKPDEEKIEIIQRIFEFLSNEMYYEAQITNPSKIIEFSIGDRNYKLDLIKRRATK